MPDENQVLESIRSHRVHIPFTEQTVGLHGQEREPSQERDVVDLRTTPSSPTGPSFVDRLIDNVGGEQAARAMHALWAQDTRAKRDRIMQLTVGFETDGSGNVVAKLFDVPLGYQAKLTRVIVELFGKIPNSAVVANAWVGVFEGEQGTSNPTFSATSGVGQLRAWAPQNSSSGLFLPALVVDDGVHQAWAYRSGKSAILQGAALAATATAGAASVRYMLEEVE